MYTNKILVFLTLLVTLSTNIFADKHVDIYINSKKIKIISQSLAKNYLYIHQKLQTSSAKLALKKDILSLDKSIKNMQTITNDDETKELVEFMFFSCNELKLTLNKPYSLENGGLVLDYAESLLEGSDLISKQSISSKDSGNLKMLETIEELKYLLERAAKYYIAFRAGYTDTVNVEQANSAVNEFELLLAKVQQHAYPSDIENGPVKKLSKYWPVSKNFYLGIKKSKLPSIVFISTKHMRSALEKLAEYHAKELN